MKKLAGIRFVDDSHGNPCLDVRDKGRANSGMQAGQRFMWLCGCGRSVTYPDTTWGSPEIPGFDCIYLGHKQCGKKVYKSLVRRNAIRRAALNSSI